MIYGPLLFWVITNFQCSSQFDFDFDSSSSSFSSYSSFLLSFFSPYLFPFPYYLSFPSTPSPFYSFSCLFLPWPHHLPFLLSPHIFLLFFLLFPLPTSPSTFHFCCPCCSSSPCPPVITVISVKDRGRDEVAYQQMTEQGEEAEGREGGGRSQWGRRWVIFDWPMT